VDYYIKWRVFDVEKFYVSFNGDELRAQNRLSQTINDGMRAEFGKRTVHDVVSGERDDIMNLLRTNADLDARRFGVQVMDVRIKRVDFPSEVSESVYRRMDAERKRVANELRSTGGAEAEKIRADADRQREVLIAEAYRTAQKTKGEGDAKASAIYGAAYGKNPEFYAFYRSMDAYKQSFSSKNDVMVLQPNSEFFRYMKSPRGGK
jgi:membrane protease subunit HflC